MDAWLFLISIAIAITPTNMQPQAVRYKLHTAIFNNCENDITIVVISNLYNFSSLCFISLKYQCSRYFSETFHMEDLPSDCNL